jgi:hypothetical protein
VTFNVRDFPAASVDPYEIEVINADTFLLDQLDLAPLAVIEELRRQAAAHRRHPPDAPGTARRAGQGRCPLVRRRSTASNALNVESAASRTWVERFNTWCIGCRGGANSAD